MKPRLLTIESGLLVCGDLVVLVFQDFEIFPGLGFIFGYFAALGGGLSRNGSLDCGSLMLICFRTHLTVC